MVGGGKSEHSPAHLVWAGSRVAGNARRPPPILFLNDRGCTPRLEEEIALVVYLEIGLVGGRGASRDAMQRKAHGHSRKRV